MFITKFDDAQLLREFKPVRVTYFLDKKGGEIHLDEACCFNARVFNPKGIETEYVEHKDKRKKSPPSPPSGFYRLADLTQEQIDYLAEVLEGGKRSCSSGDYKEQSRRRAVKRMRNYALANSDLDLFVTLTLSPERVDRADYGATIRRVGQWLDNRVRRSGLKYLLVPELHENGGVHFHGFFNRSAVRLENSGLKRDIHAKSGEFKNFRPEIQPYRKGKVVYNLPDFDLGFTTALRIGKSWEDREKAVAYCLKYMSKGADKVGGRWYLHGGDLDGARYAYFDYGEAGKWTETFDSIAAPEFSITDNLKCKVVKGEKLDLYGGIWDLFTVSRLTTERENNGI